MTTSEKIAAIQAKMGQTAISQLTAYDYPTARMLDEAGIDMILVGDSLGMTMLGYPDTTHVTLAHMLHHGECVARGAKNALVILDMPIHTFDTPEQALENARKLMETGVDAVKLEGGAAKEAEIRAIVQAGIEGGADWFIVEQDMATEGFTPMQSIEISAKYLLNEIFA